MIYLFALLNFTSVQTRGWICFTSDLRGRHGESSHARCPQWRCCVVVGMDFLKYDPYRKPSSVAMRYQYHFLKSEISSPRCEDRGFTSNWLSEK